MPKSPIERAIEQATNENSVAENWSLFLEIIDQINALNYEKEAIKIFTRRLYEKDPHIVDHTLTLLNACVKNCARNFSLEVSSRVFIDELRQFVTKKSKRFAPLSEHLLLACRLANMIQDWATNDEYKFKSDPALNLIPSLYYELMRSGIQFKQIDQVSASSLASNSSTNTKAAPSNGNSSSMSSVKSAEQRKEEEDLAKAIQLSLKETTASNSGLKSSSNNSSHTTSTTSSLFDTQMLNKLSISNGYSTSTTNNSGGKSNGQQRKVKALYDFEAVEENEMTFKAGDLLVVLDDSDENWWKGRHLSADTEGLFPSNFVTTDLNAQVEVYEPVQYSNGAKKSVKFNENVNVKELEVEQRQMQPKAPAIDEAKIDECLEQLQNADPSLSSAELIDPVTDVAVSACDSAEMLELEDDCYMMGPLIDKQLEFIDYKHAGLEELNLKILEAFQMYNNLMKESLHKVMAPPQLDTQPQMAPASMANYLQQYAAQNAAPPSLSAIPNVGAAPFMPHQQQPNMDQMQQQHFASLQHYQQTQLNPAATGAMSPGGALYNNNMAAYNSNAMPPQQLQQRDSFGGQIENGTLKQ